MLPKKGYSMNPITDTLSQFPLFTELSEGVHQEVALATHKRTFRSGQMIVLEGEPSRVVYLIITGEVRIQRSSPEGREYVLHTLGPGRCFNLVSVLDGGTILARDAHD
jgi:CRP/FNR family transcriptional regulator